jgi:hypothetical protein
LLLDGTKPFFEAVLDGSLEHVGEATLAREEPELVGGPAPQGRAGPAGEIRLGDGSG